MSLLEKISLYLFVQSKLQSYSIWEFENINVYNKHGSSGGEFYFSKP